jgi:Lrp/AsnC family transcriptional regulator, leucine-responsive regulatory protein
MNTLKSNLDPTDWAILRELQLDARLSYAEIGRRVGLSSPAVQERIRKLEDAEIINGYHAKVNPKALGLPIMAFARMSDVHGENIEAVARIANETPEILRCYHLIGQDEYLLQIVAPSVEYLNNILQQFTPHANTITSIVTTATTNSHIISPDLMPYLEEDNL